MRQDQTLISLSTVGLTLLKGRLLKKGL